jgi:hypothetical protein
MRRCGGINQCLKCFCSFEAESIKPRYALYGQLPLAILLELF